MIWTARELRELAYMGATVLHEDAIFPVRKEGIPINIRNTNAPDEKGTLIVESTCRSSKYTVEEDYIVEFDRETCEIVREWDAKKIFPIPGFFAFVTHDFDLFKELRRFLDFVNYNWGLVGLKEQHGVGLRQHSHH